MHLIDIPQYKPSGEVLKAYTTIPFVASIRFKKKLIKRRRILINTFLVIKSGSLVKRKLQLNITSKF
jgi:hypothetical protein